LDPDFLLCASGSRFFYNTDPDTTGKNTTFSQAITHILGKFAVLRIGIRLLRIRILEFFGNPDPDPEKKTTHFYEGNKKMWGDILLSTKNRELLYGVIFI